MLTSVLKALINAPKIATTPTAPTHAAAMLVTLSILMGMAVTTLTSVYWVLPSALRIAKTPLAPTPVGVELDID